MESETGGIEELGGEVTLTATKVKGIDKKSKELAFGSNAHKTLLKCLERKKESKYILFLKEQGYITSRNKLTPEGLKRLQGVSSKGPEVKKGSWTPEEYLMKLTAERLLHSSLWKHDTFTVEDSWLEAKGLLYLSNGAYHKTPAGEQWLRDNAAELIGSGFMADKKALIELTPLEALPQLLVHKNIFNRQLAQQRYKQLTGKEITDD